MAETGVAVKKQTGIALIQTELSNPDIKSRIDSRLGQKAGTFITSLLDVCGEDKNLAECDPKLIIKEALKAAGLDLPINKNLGFAHLIPYKEKGVMKPHFQMGYKGYIQLAIRTGQYKYLNSGVVFEGETVLDDRIRGTLEITGKKTSEKAIGYFAYMQLINGFEKAVFWTIAQVEAHAKRFSKSFDSSSTPWKTDFDAMAMKTMLLQLVPKFGPMTIEMSVALESDKEDFKGFDGAVHRQITDGSNQDTIDIDPEPAEAKEPETETAPGEKDKAPRCSILKCDANNNGGCMSGFTQDDNRCKEYRGVESTDTKKENRKPDFC